MILITNNDIYVMKLNSMADKKQDQKLNIPFNDGPNRVKKRIHIPFI